MTGMTTKTCEIRDCGRRVNSTTNGIATCERCRIDFVSVGFGAVYFAGRWHGVSGASYDAAQLAVFPGLEARP